MGAKLASPEKFVVNFMGDAAFGMTGLDFETAARSGIPILTVVLNNSTNEIYPILSAKTILATGGLGQLFLHTTNPKEATGDGIAMAWRAGARCFNLHYIQFHPTALYHPTGRFLISEALRGEGGKLVNAHGKEFMHSYHRLGALAPRDVVSRAIHTEMIKEDANCMFLDITHKNKQ